SSDSPLGGTMVLNSVEHIAPWHQVSPRCRSGRVVGVNACQVWEHLLMPLITPAGLLNAFCWTAPRPISDATLTTPTSLVGPRAAGVPTVDSAKATVLDVPSITAPIALLCWNAKRPVVGTLDRFGVAVLVFEPPPPRISVVAPMEPK